MEMTMEEIEASNAYYYAAAAYAEASAEESRDACRHRDACAAMWKRLGGEMPVTGDLLGCGDCAEWEEAE